MKFKVLLDKFLFMCSVPKCVCCGSKLLYGDRGLCADCLKVYNEHKKRNCPRCAKILSECFCSSEYLVAHGIKHTVKLFRYAKTEESMPSNYLIYSLKQDNRNDVIDFFAEELTASITNSINLKKGKYIITSVPRRKRAIVNYGFDHAEVLAKRVAKALGVEYRQFLVSKSKKPQKSVVGESRLYNAKFDYKSKKDISLKGYTVIIIDDVITTGASMSSSATLIKGYKPSRVIAAALGIAYKDRNTKQIYSALD